MTSRTVVVFSGPTLPAAEGRSILDATWLPPAGQGDVYAAARQRPWGIGIIDGYFERVPSVWHKEILWAMSRGVHVFGAASMGALRAAELTAFGMEGVGRVYEAFRDGELEDDDEVAVTHAPAEFGFRAASDAMVNIRATLAAAVAAGVIAAADEEAVRHVAKARHYSARRWDDICASSTAAIGDEGSARLRKWVREHHVDQKRADALAMLAHIEGRRASHPKPKRVTFTFQSTDSWHQVREQVDDRELGTRPGGDTALPDAALEELRLLGAAWHEQRDRALARLLALELAERIDVQPTAAEIDTARTALRTRHGLNDTAALDAWAQSQALGAHDLDRLLAEEARSERIEAIAAVVLPTYLRDWLRLDGRYGALLARARDKQSRLHAAGLDRPTAADAALGESSIWDWYFGEHLGCAVPDDLPDWARAHDFETEHELHLAALRERCYQQLIGAPADAPSRGLVEPGT